MAVSNNPGRLSPDMANELVPISAHQLPRSLSNPPDRILPWLYLGDHGASIQYAALVDRGITHVLNVKGGFRFPKPPYDEQLTMHGVPLCDNGTSDLSVSIDECFDFINSAHDQGGACLVHCSQGINRSPTITLAYLIGGKHTRWTLRDAWNHVKARRSVTSPHHSYWNQLETLEGNWHNVVSPSITAEQADILVQ